MVVCPNTAQVSGYVCRIIIGVIAFLSRPANTNIQYHLGPDVEIGDSQSQREENKQRDGKRRNRRVKIETER